jgi:hypothetical protein
MGIRQDVQFSAHDGTLPRAWLYCPENPDGRLPVVTLAHGFDATEFHGLDQ